MENEQASIQVYQQAAEMCRIATRAVCKAQEENRWLNVPNLYSPNRQLYYDWPELLETDTNVSGRPKRGGGE